MRLGDDSRIRSELAACLARESVWKIELHSTRVEVQMYVTAAITINRISAEEIEAMREEYHKSTNEST